MPHSVIAHLANSNGLDLPEEITIKSVCTTRGQDYVRCRFGYIDCPEFYDVCTLKSRSDPGSWRITVFVRGRY